MAAGKAQDKPVSTHPHFIENKQTSKSNTLNFLWGQVEGEAP